MLCEMPLVGPVLVPVIVLNRVLRRVTLATPNGIKPFAPAAVPIESQSSFPAA
ncbi:MAG: hypothetical protein ABIK86_02650 [candidate division WOR-3 bacterium]